MMKRRSVVLLTGGVCLPGCINLLDGSRHPNHFDMRGKIDIVIDGDPVDLTADRFQTEYADDAALAFYLQEADEYWYMKGEERVTPGEAIELLPHFEYDRFDGNDVITFDGATYDAADQGTLIEFFANDVEVDPLAYTLQNEDVLRIDILTGL